MGIWGKILEIFVELGSNWVEFWKVRVLKFCYFCFKENENCWYVLDVFGKELFDVSLECELGILGDREKKF